MNVALYPIDSIECHIHVLPARMWSIPEREPAAGPGYSTAVAVARAGHFGPDPLYDLVRFVFGNLDELVCKVAALGRD